MTIQGIPGTGPELTLQAGPGPVDPAAICPFLNRFDSVGGELAAFEAPDVANLCTAGRGGPRSPSLRQQEHLCLRASHPSCPLYEHATGGVRRPVRPAGGPRPRRADYPGFVRPGGVSRATLLALAVVAFSLGVALAWVVVRGSLGLPGTTDGHAPATGVPSAPVESPSAMRSGPIGAGWHLSTYPGAPRP